MSDKPRTGKLVIKGNKPVDDVVLGIELEPVLDLLERVERYFDTSDYIRVVDSEAALQTATDLRDLLRDHGRLK